ncbi:hypothetical protein MYAM1_000788 [Malassezia yamatoensis]|uniref:Uncharacterized protein n=1 Tax=Malassezia yamatoensis TaxID=253288 RepID=A0AAJ6CHQ0_9BASI|nr:hypothetical protein MYAM1_000788 [Malassezia yamatoensis]
MSTSELRRKAGANEQVLSQYDEQVMDEQVDDLTYLPAFPIYAVVVSILLFLIWLASYEVADQLRLVKPQEFSFPRQPHPFGTAPWWIVPVLRDLRLQPSKNLSVEKGKAPEKQELSKVLPPRLTYVGFLWVCTWPIPLMTFGLGAFDDALWWSFAFMGVTIHLLVEYWIYKADREAIGLSGLKYNYKGA